MNKNVQIKDINASGSEFELQFRHNISWLRRVDGTFAMKFGHYSAEHSSLEVEAYEYNHDNDRVRKVMASVSLGDMVELRDWLSERIEAYQVNGGTDIE